MVEVDYRQRDGRTQRGTVTDASEELGAIRLDSHAPAAPVALLPSR
jgi:hypothetical protein